MYFAQHTTKLFGSLSAALIVNIRIASHQCIRGSKKGIVPNWVRFVTTTAQCNTAGLQKFIRDTLNITGDDQMAMFKRLVNAFPDQTVITLEQWRAFFEPTGEPSQVELYITLVGLSNIESPTGSLESAQNLLKAFNIEPNACIEAKLITHYYAKRYTDRGLTDADEAEVLRMCNAMIDENLHREKRIKRSIALGLAITSEWKRALSLPKSSLSSGGCTILANRAIRSSEWDILWSALLECKQIASSVLNEFIDECGRSERTVLDAQMPRMLGQLERCRELVAEDQAHEMIRLLTEAGKEAELAILDHSGVCSACQQSIEPVTVNDDELEQLRSSFFIGVVESRASTSTEGRSFMKFMRTNGPFDLVIDGLNVSYEDHLFNAHMLADAVDHLIERKNRILVIGREYMLNLPAALLDRIRAKAYVFLTKDESKDDVFVLYAAIVNASNGCDYLSNDIMGDHANLAGDCTHIFYRWRKQHWLAWRRDDTGNLFTFYHNRFKDHCHEHNGRWHLPIVTDNEPTGRLNNLKIRKQWACVKL